VVKDPRRAGGEVVVGVARGAEWDVPGAVLVATASARRADTESRMDRGAHAIESRALRVGLGW
jgi:hypothetical protein